MSIPSAPPAPAPARGGFLGWLVRPDRPPLTRPQEGRWLAGVAVGLAAHLQVPVLPVRVVLAVSTVTGFGPLLYLWLWAGVSVDRVVPPRPGGPRGFSDQVAAPADLVAPAELVPVVPADHVAPALGVPAELRADAEGAGEREVPRGSARRGDVVGGLILVAVGFALLAGRLGWDAGFPVLPIVIVIGGAVLAYLQLDEVSRSRWTARGVVGTRGALLRVAAGLVLVIFGVLLAVIENAASFAAIGHTLVAVAAVLAGAVIVLAPWGVRLWRDLGTERAERARESERADIAAHLHDSVLQTLALIQRSSADPAEVTRLARAQERDLRGWLYTGAPVDESRLVARVTRIGAEAEDVYGVVVDVVTVGDRDTDQRVSALLAALREAVVNAARHAGGGEAGGRPTVRIYVESSPDGVEAFVRDRGVGFDLDAVPTDRLGVRESILGRMRRHGGTAEVISSPGQGTEVRLLLPDRADDLDGRVDR